MLILTKKGYKKWPTGTFNGRFYVNQLFMNYNLHLRNTLLCILHKPKQINIWNLSVITQKRQMLQIFLNNLMTLKTWMIYNICITC